MKKACFVVNDASLKNNTIFKENFHRDNCTDRFIKLRKAFLSKGYDLSTQDVNPPEASDIILYAMNMPRALPAIEDIEKSYLILSESIFIRPDNYDSHKHSRFNRIFTWEDNLVDGKKYHKLNYAHDFPQRISKDIAKKKKLCVLIAGNKKVKSYLPVVLQKLDLYSEREKAIRWFETHHPNEFDLYGVGWDQYQFNGRFVGRFFNKLPTFAKITQKILRKSYTSYKGVIDHKAPIMEKYRFSICYENARDIPGYITEKIFDSFFAGCVPVYLGANNVTTYIPKSCFIDKRDFANYEELYGFMSRMTDEVYLGYLANIEKYLKSEQALPFKSEYFVQTIMKQIFKQADEF